MCVGGMKVQEVQPVSSAINQIMWFYGKRTSYEHTTRKHCI